MSRKGARDQGTERDDPGAEPDARSHSPGAVVLGHVWFLISRLCADARPARIISVPAISI
jgi:hypothetical protein